MMGGWVGGEWDPTASVITYDAEADEWEAAPPLPMASRDGTAATIDGRILLFGAGVDSTRATTIQYENAAWSVVPGSSALPGSVCGCQWLFLG